MRSISQSLGVISTAVRGAGYACGKAQLRVGAAWAKSCSALPTLQRSMPLQRYTWLAVSLPRAAVYNQMKSLLSTDATDTPSSVICRGPM
jgi:hypothetical protein